MATVREQILDAVVTALNAGAPAGFPVATRTNPDPYEPGALPAVTVFPTDESVSDVGASGHRRGPVTNRRLTFRVECRAIGEPPETALDPMIAWVVKALAGSTMGGLAHDVQEQRTEWVVEAAEEVYGLASVEFAVDYRTLTNNLEAQK